MKHTLFTGLCGRGMSDVTNERIQAYSALGRITMALTSSASSTFEEIIDLEELKKPAQTNFQTLKKQNVTSFTHNNH